MILLFSWHRGVILPFFFAVIYDNNSKVDLSDRAEHDVGNVSPISY